MSSNQVLQAVAIEASSTDSLVGTRVYQIDTPNVIDYPSGFMAGNLIHVGFASLSGSAYRVSDDTTGTAGAIWFPAPVTVSSFSTTFTLEWDHGVKACASSSRTARLPSPHLPTRIPR